MRTSPRIEAVIFDMDGVLTDSEPLYQEAARVTLREAGLSLTAEETREVMPQILGTSVEYTWEWLRRRFELQGPIEGWIEHYSSVILSLLREKVTPAPGLYQLLDELEGRGLKKALASSSQRGWVEAVLEKLGLKGRFQVIISGEEVQRGKPDPEICLKAARALDIAPERCLVIEDSPVGLQAAKAAGMKAVAVLTATTEKLDLSQADRVIPSLKDFDFALLE